MIPSKLLSLLLLQILADVQIKTNVVWYLSIKISNTFWGKRRFVIWLLVEPLKLMVGKRELLKVSHVSVWCNMMSMVTKQLKLIFIHLHVVFWSLFQSSIQVWLSSSLIMDWVTWINELYHSGVISKQLKLRELNIQLFKSFKERMKSRGQALRLVASLI